MSLWSTIKKGAGKLLLGADILVAVRDAVRKVLKKKP
jgi:hypothetical protein